MFYLYFTNFRIPGNTTCPPDKFTCESNSQVGTYPCFTYILPIFEFQVTRHAHLTNSPASRTARWERTHVWTGARCVTEFGTATGGKTKPRTAPPGRADPVSSGVTTACASPRGSSATTTTIVAIIPTNLTTAVRVL